MKLHGFAPKLGFDAEILPPTPFCGGGVTHRYGWVMTDLLGYVFEALIFSDTLVRFSWEKYETSLKWRNVKKMILITQSNSEIF